MKKWTTAAWGALALWTAFGTLAARASEFEVVATSLTVDSQINLSSAAYFGTKTPTTVANPNAANLDPTLFPTPGGLYFDGTYYNVWDRVNSAWVRLATGTVKSELGSADVADGSLFGQDIANSTITLNKLNPSGCASGEVVKYNGTNWACGVDNGVGSETDPSAVHIIGAETVTGAKTFSAGAGLTVTYAVNAASAVFLSGIRASSGTFTAVGAAQYSVEASSGVLATAGPVNAPFFLGNGRTLTGVVTTDTNQTITGDKTMGSLGVGGTAPGAYVLQVGGTGNAQFSTSGYVDILGLTVGKVGTVTTFYSGTGTGGPVIFRVK